MLRRVNLLGRGLAGVLLGAAAAALLVPAALFPEATGAEKVPGADKLKPILKKLYGDLDFLKETTQRTMYWSELDAAMAAAAGKDKRNTALKHPKFWAESIHEVLFTGDLKTRKSGKVKTLAEDDVVWQGADGKEVKARFAYHCGASYSPKAAAPVLISFLEKGADAKAWITNNWLAHEDMKKGWILVAAPVSAELDIAKDPLSFMRLLGKVLSMYNVDDNRIYLEGVGAAGKDLQTALTQKGGDRVAGLLLRNPQEAVVNENTTLMTSVAILRIAEAADAAGAAKSKAVAEAYAKVEGGRAPATIEAPDAASLAGACVPAAEWLKAHTGRVTLSSYSYVTVLSADGASGEVWTGSLYINSPAVRGQPTKLKVTYVKETNTVELVSENLGDFELFMNDELLDLDKEVTVKVNGSDIAKRTFDRTTDTMLGIADLVREYGRFFPASYVGMVPSPLPTEAKDGKPGDKPADKPGEKPGDKPAEKPGEKPAEKPAEKPGEKPGEKK